MNYRLLNYYCFIKATKIKNSSQKKQTGRYENNLIVFSQNPSKEFNKIINQEKL